MDRINTPQNQSRMKDKAAFKENKLFFKINSHVGRSSHGQTGDCKMGERVKKCV